MLYGLIENPWVILIVLIWTVTWTGYALWTAARRGEKWWFIALLVTNTVGILDIVYILWWTKRDTRSSARKKTISKKY